jgi:hypothetical protein
MKNIIIITVLLVVVTWFSCNEEPIGQQPKDSVPPGPVTGITVKNTPGGAVLRYRTPDDEDLLYVKAVYSLKNREEVETKASVYADSLTVVGFGDTLEHAVKLITVDRSRNESVPESIVIKPLTPDVLSIADSLYMVPDFGGLRVLWQNANKAEISINVLEKDSNEEYVPLQSFYSSAISGIGIVTGMDTIPGDFALYVQDHWGNQSEKKFYSLTPLYQAIFDRFKFSVIVLPNDELMYANYTIDKAWDGNKNGDPCVSSPGNTGGWPQAITMDLGVLGKVSRIRIFQREPYGFFAGGNIRTFEVWGCETIDYSGNWDSWIKLMDCASVKPSGLPVGQNTDEDDERGRNGEDFFNSPENPKVRYLRINVKSNWSGGDNFTIGEIEIYGDYR